MPREYSLSFTQATIAAASGDYDLFEISPADDAKIELVGITLMSSSETGDAAEEILPIQVIRGHTTGGNGTATTPRPMDPADAAAACAAETIATTIASAGTPVTLHADGFNVRAGYQLWWPDGFGLQATQANTTIVVRSSATVADDLTLSGTLYFREG